MSRPGEPGDEMPAVGREQVDQVMTESAAAEEVTAREAEAEEFVVEYGSEAEGYAMEQLPKAVRHKVIQLAAEALGRMGPDDLPGPLRQIARFAPAKRARLAANTIATCLESDVVFRHRVAERAVDDADVVGALREGTAPKAADPVDLAAVAYLLRSPGWAAHIEAAAKEAEREASEAQAARETATVTRLQEQLSAARTAARDDRERWKAEIERLKVENTTLRRRLAAARERASVAEAEQQLAVRHAQETVETADRAQTKAEAEARRLRTRLSETEAALEKARRDVREDRGIAAAKLRLLLDTLTDAARGLGQELALPPSELRPADTVPAAEPGLPGRVVGGHVAAEDPARLEVLLALPRVHMVIDGYNVTKQEWGDMSLEAQRQRLVHALGALASRTGAEITCVFDGAKLDQPPPIVSPRGVRVRFSLPGQTADDLICELVAAEPPGRPVVVVSTDREVQQGVRRPGVYPIPSLALVRLVAR